VRKCCKPLLSFYLQSRFHVVGLKYKTGQSFERILRCSRQLVIMIMIISYATSFPLILSFPSHELDI
jgi:hypothetical protein